MTKRGWLSSAEGLRLSRLGVLVFVAQLFLASLASAAVPTDISLAPSKVMSTTDTSSGYVVGSLSTTDADPGDTFTYSIVAGGADNAVFAVVGGNTLQLTDGVIDIASPTDANADGVYEVMVRTTDSTSNTFDKLLQVKVVPVYNPLVHSSLSTDSTKWATSGGWGIAGGKYGAFTCGTCHAKNTGNIKRIKTTFTAPNGTDQFPIEAAAGSVSFQDVREGSSDFGDDSRVDKTQSTDVCEGCHTYDPTQTDGVKYHGYNMTAAGDPGHHNKADCITCHQHSDGFKPQACDSCHGFPPTDTSAGGPTGLANNPFSTGSTTAGAHQKHAITLGYACTNCHDGYAMPVESSVNPGFGDVSISFNNFGLTTGSYTGQSGVSYNDTLGSGTQSCSAVYCHGSTLSGSVNPTWNGAAMTCGNCHAATAGTVTGLPSGASHDQHANTLGLECSECHGTGYTGGTSTPANHVGGAVSWSLNISSTAFGASAKYNGAASGSTGSVAPSVSYSNCSSVYCHDPSSTGKVSPTWGSAAVTTCTSCHGNDSSSGDPMASGKHTAHIDNADPELGSFDCGYCHANTVTVGDNGTITGAAHVNQTKDVAYGATLTGTDGTCTTVYCHSDGKGGYNDQVLSTAWAGAATLDCKGCHGDNGSSLVGEPDYASVGLGQTTSNSHGKHVTIATDCNNCHTSTTSTGTDITGALHLNKAIDVTIPNTLDQGDTNPANNYDATVGVKTCSNIYCHDPSNTGKVSPSWGGTTTCITCHGNNAASGSPMATAAHGKHMNGGNTVMTDKECATCHAATVSSGDDGTITGTVHANQVKDVSILSTYDSNADGTDNFTSGACSNVYCHSDGKATPTYSSINWTTGSITDCVSCHQGASATTTLSGAHKAHVDSTVTGPTIGKTLGCADCHSATVSDNTTISTPANHIDKTVEKIDCSTNSCHSDGNAGNLTYNTPNFASDTYGCDSCHGANVADGNSFPDYADGNAGTVNANSHNAHVGSSNINCEQCHETTSTVGTSIDGTDGTQHVDGGIDVSMKQGGTFDQGATETCSATYCHGAGSSPAWGTIGPLTCDTCHSASNALENSHGVHYASATVATSADLAAANDSTTTTYQFSCGNCHNGTNHAGGEVTAGVQSAEVSLANGGTYTAAGTTAAASPDRGFNYTAGSCDTNACHNDGTAAKGAPNTNPTWTGTLAADCTGCHNNNAAASQTMASNAHGAHINGGGAYMADKTCNTCHNKTVDGTDRAIADKTQHVNGVQNVDIAATYDSDTTSNNNFSANNCSNVYCHSDGKATPTYQSIDWTTGSITDCVSCHGGPGVTTTLSASHLAHIGTDATDTNKQFGFTCDDCHAQTASNNTTISTPANHVNTSRDVAVSAANGGTGAIGGNYGAVTAGSCATTQCHGTASPDWSAGTTTGDCSACHGMAANPADGRDTNGDTANTDQQVGAHVNHLTAGHGWTSAVACAQCHKTTVTNQTAAGTYVGKVNAVGHIDSASPAELTFDTMASNNGATPVYDGATCAATYCHDGSKIGSGMSGTLNIPDWNTPFFTGTASHDCGFCHGYPPNPANGHPNDTNCHTCHTNVLASNDGFTVVSQHINGTVESDADSCTTCHGSGAYEDPNTNSPDHSVHTNVDVFLAGKTLSGNDFGNAATGWYDVVYDASGNPVIGCGQCHEADVALHRNSAINVKLDTTGETTIPATNAKNNNSSPNWDGANCTNVYCHSDGNGTFKTSPTWDGTANNAGVTCATCHGNAPNTGTHNNHAVGIHYDSLYDGSAAVMAAGGTTGSGAAHGDTNTASTIACQTCHNATVAVDANGDMINATMTIGGVAGTGCSNCHTAGGANPGDGSPAIKPSSTTHLNGAKDVVFADLSTFKSKAQIRNDIATVSELNAYWTRNNGYKASSSFDRGNAASPIYAGGGGSCSAVACHNGIATPNWSGGAAGDCTNCHTSLP